MPAPTATAEPAATTLDRSDESAIAALYRAAIGAVNPDYYLPIFTRFEAVDRAGPSWNWAASFYTLNWMVFRKMWRIALVYAATAVGVAFLVFGIGRPLFLYSETVEIILLVAFTALCFTIPGVYGNAIFHVESRKKMARALSANSTLPEACAMLNQLAASRQRFVWLALANMALAIAAAGAYLAFPVAGTQPLSSPQIGESRKPTVGRAMDVAHKPLNASSGTLLAPTTSASAAPVAASPALTSQTTQGAVEFKLLKPVPNPSNQAAVASAPPATALAQAPTATAAHPKTSASALAPKQHFYINVGLFANDTNARNAHAKLLGAGLAAFTQELNTAQGMRTRVRAGPFDTQPEADSAVEKIHALKLDAIIFQR